MARHKDADWTLPGPRAETWEQVQVALLMDIRDELKKLNRVFACGNFLDMPRQLQRTREAVERTDKRMAVKVPLKGPRKK